MQRSGYADLPLHYGQVPPWLYERMALLGGAITESIILNYGKSEFLRRLSDPLWFQSLGCVMGMDWHSSGITTSVMGALKKSINPHSKELGIYICGGKGKYSLETPKEIRAISEKTGLDANHLIRCSRLSARVDNNAIQDGFQLYLHSFILTDTGEWAVIQQGMSDASGMARRYHWLSSNVKSFVETPHTFIYGKNQGSILNLTDSNANNTRSGVLNIVKENPDRMLAEIKKIVMPLHHDVKAKDVDLKRLGSVLAVAQNSELLDFESLLLLEGLGPRTLQSLVLVSEVIHGTPSRFTDPARFSFAHGGKDGHPFPVPVKVYDETISFMKDSVAKAKLGLKDKEIAIKKLSAVAERLENDFVPNENFDELIAKENKDSYKYGGRTVFGEAVPFKRSDKNGQLKLF